MSGEKTLGQVACEAWAVRSAATWTWSTLKPRERETWEAAAKAVADAVRDEAKPEGAVLPEPPPGPREFESARRIFESFVAADLANASARDGLGHDCAANRAILSAIAFEKAVQNFRWPEGE